MCRVLTHGSSHTRMYLFLWLKTEVRSLQWCLRSSLCCQPPVAVDLALCKLRWRVTLVEPPAWGNTEAGCLHGMVGALMAVDTPLQVASIAEEAEDEDGAAGALQPAAEAALRLCSEEVGAAFLGKVGAPPPPPPPPEP